jgi:cellulose synthase/poly-beta-1,6-N-acetylglucosamine synthase-like glycosyltransferase
MRVEDQVVAAGRADAPAPPPLARVLDRLSVWDEAIRSRWPFTALVGPDLDEEAPSGNASRLLLRPALFGFVAMCAIALGVSLPQSPFTLKQSGAWFFGVPDAGSSASSSTSAELFCLVTVFAGLVLFIRAWCVVLRTLSRRQVSVGALVALVALWIVPILVVAPMFSRDAYGYAAQGEMMSHHISPYHYGPSVLGAAPSVSFVAPQWLNSSSSYGPLFMQIDGVLTSLSLHHELPNLILLRLLALAGVALMALGVVSLARSSGRDPGFAFALAVLNPVTLLVLVGGAHPDALMLGLLVCGLALAHRRRPVAGIVLCSLAAAIEAPAALGILYIGWQWMGTSIPLRRRLRPLVTAGLLSGALLAALSAVTGLGWDWVTNLGTAGTSRSWGTPTSGAGILLTDAAHFVGASLSFHGVLTVTRALGLGVALCLGLWLLWRSDRIGPLQAMGLSLLAVVALGPVVQPWYLAWGLVLLAPMATGKTRSLIVALSAGAAFFGLPGGRALLSDLLEVGPRQLALAVLVLLFVLVVPLNGSARPRRHFFELPIVQQILLVEGVTVGVVTLAVTKLDDVSRYSFNVVKLAGACALGMFALYSVIEAIAAMRSPRLPPAPEGPRPPVTAVIPAYLPNEATIIVDTVVHHLTTGPSDLQLIVAYNTPTPYPVERELAFMAEEDPRLTLLHVTDSHSKAENVNAALEIATGEIVAVFDADHYPAGDCYDRAWRWLAAGADVVQGRCVVRKQTGARNSIVSLSVTGEFEQMYAVGHPGRTRIMGIGLFGGSNGFWKAATLKRIKLDPTALTEDIDASVRLLLAGGRIATDPGIVSSELPPPSLEALCNQRLRWNQGWFQVGRRHLVAVIRDRGITVRRRFGVFWLWGWGTVLPWIGALSIPLTLHGWLHHDVSRWSRIIGYILLFGTVSFLVHVGTAFRKTIPGTRRPTVYGTYIAANLVFYAYIRVSLTRLGHIHQLAGRTEWFVTPRTTEQVGAEASTGETASLVPVPAVSLTS